MTKNRYVPLNCSVCDCSLRQRASDRNRTGMCITCFNKSRTIINKIDIRLKRIWVNMHSRCLKASHKSYPRYGGRGITIFEPWVLSFEDFRDWAVVTGYQDHLTLERMDNDKGYCPKNCVWIEKEYQSYNKSSGLNWVLVNEIRALNKTVNYPVLAEKYGVHKTTIVRVVQNRIWVDASYQPIPHPLSESQSHRRRPTFSV